METQQMAARRLARAQQIWRWVGAGGVIVV
jgi:hypothetical protein